MLRLLDRILRFDAPVAVENLSGRTMLDIDLSEIDLAGWCLGLCLVDEGLIDILLLAGSKKLRVAQSDSKRFPVRATLKLESEPMALTISPAELDCWRSFFFKWYRDGSADADHLDVDAEILPRRGERKPDQVWVPKFAHITFRVKPPRVKDALPPSEEKKESLGVS